MNKIKLFAATAASVILSGCASFQASLPGFVFDVPQSSLTPVTPALECARGVISEALAKKYASGVDSPQVVIFLDGFYDGTIPYGKSTINGPLGDYFEREFGRALVRYAPSTRQSTVPAVRVSYSTPESLNTKYYVGPRELDEIITRHRLPEDLARSDAKKKLLELKSGLTSDISERERRNYLAEIRMLENKFPIDRDRAVYILVRGVFTQADEAPVRQSGFGVNGSASGENFSLTPSLGNSSSAQTLALTLDLSNLGGRMVDASNTLVMSVGTARSDGSMRVTIDDVTLGLTFQDETRASLQSGQRALVEAGAFWTLSALFDRMADITPCVGTGDAAPDEQARHAVMWNNLSHREQRRALTEKLQEAGYYSGSVSEIDEHALRKAINEAGLKLLSRSGSTPFPFSDGNLGLLYLRLIAHHAQQKG
ncbi:MAG: hypothetical protein HQL41_02615 [Alphaproteobacteria bacterium]|nr:hypothetical protein [Alphaproteobacteria bacterium]